MTGLRTTARLHEAAAADTAFDWDRWNADMDARFAACQRAEDAWRKQAEAAHEAGLELVASFERAIASLKGAA